MGITGGAGSGKSSVAAILRRLGWHVVDVDEMARNAIQNDPVLLAAIQREFGSEYIEEGVIKRKELAGLLFASRPLLQKYNRLVWPRMKKKLAEEIRHAEGQPARPVAADMAVLFESGSQKLFDVILLVTAPREQKMTRLRLQRRWSGRQAMMRMSGQWPDMKKKKQAHYVIHNDRDLDSLEEKTRGFIQWLQMHSAHI